MRVQPKRISFVTKVLGLALIGFLPVLLQVNAQTVDSPIQPQQREADVPYVSTPHSVVYEMLRLAKVGKDDVLYDLGSGDGRIAITAAKSFGARATGIEIRPELVQRSRENAKRSGVDDRVKFLQQDIFEADLREASVVTLYLLPEINVKLRPKLLRELKPGTRIVSHAFDMGLWKPDRVVRVHGDGGQYTVYYWVVPEEIPPQLR
jgi:SAM-dependent methyltransferase